MSTPTTKNCITCKTDKPASDFYAKAKSPDGLSSSCRACNAAARQAQSAARAARGDTPRTARGPRAHRAETVTNTHARVMVQETGYVRSKRLTALADTVREVRDKRDAHPMVLLFLGPSGSGKTAAAEDLAFYWNLPYTKVDATSMPDTEAWFGTREIVAEHGVPVTVYTPSDFVTAITQPGVLFIDEMNRATDEVRKILLGLIDGTHSITNPLTGGLVEKHPDCYIIMAGNRGVQFTGTYPIDPAFMTRAVIEKFDYLPREAEVQVAVDRTGISQEIAELFVRFANETRVRAETDPDMIPISTREIITACKLATRMDVDDAAMLSIINGADDQGAEGSLAFRLEGLWTAIRKPVDPDADPNADPNATQDTSWLANRHQ